jgi:hypothetical protein
MPLQAALAFLGTILSSSRLIFTDYSSPSEPTFPISTNYRSKPKNSAKPSNNSAAPAMRPRLIGRGLEPTSPKWSSTSAPTNKAAAKNNQPTTLYPDARLYGRVGSYVTPPSRSVASIVRCFSNATFAGQPPLLALLTLSSSSPVFF